MKAESIREMMVRARTLIVHVERHLDAASDKEDLTELGRAWVRAVQLERVLAAALPPEVVSDIDAELHWGTGSTGPTGTSSNPRPTAEAPDENRSRP